MGQVLGNLKNAGNIQEANLSDLSTAEKMQRGIIGGIGGLRGMPTQNPTQGGTAAPIGIAPPQPVDFSQIGRRNPFYGGY